MSIILKALKKAEESRGEERVSVPKGAFVYRVRGLKFLGIFLGLAAISVVFILGYFFYIYSSTTKRSATLQKHLKTLSAGQHITATQAKPEIPDINKLNEDAVRAIKKGNYTDAESLLKKGIGIKPDNAMLYNNLGLALRGQSRYKEAIQAYERALKLKPDFPEALNNIALAMDLSGDKRKALEFYKKALSLRPAYTEAHLNIALLLESMGNNKEAESHYHTFLNISQDTELKKKVRERLSIIKK